MSTESEKEWARLFSAGFHAKAMISKADARRLGRIAVKTFNKERCVECGINPNRGGKARGAYLCQTCFESA